MTTTWAPAPVVVVLLTDAQLEAEIRAASGDYLARLQGEATRRGLR